VRVNGQPGLIMRGPAEPPIDEQQRVAALQAQARLLSGDVDARRLGEIMRQVREATPHGDEVRVISVLTVDVVDGRIQAVRVVRNPDKLAHL
jgi:RNA polymerase sigma-70 factor (ECF subfamily)